MSTSRVESLPEPPLASRQDPFARASRGSVRIRPARDRNARAGALLLVALAAVGCKTKRTLPDYVDRGSIALKQEVDEKRRAVDEMDREGFTALHRALERSNIDATSTLLALGADLERPDGRGRAPLFIAAQSGNVQEIYLLLVAGAQVNSSSFPEGMRPLEAAVGARSGPATRMLLGAGADVNGTNRWGQTALHAAARADWVAGPQFVQLLLLRGADVDVAGEDGFTPLHTAAAHDNVPVIELLVKHGANLDRPTRIGNTPLDVALGLRCDLAAQALLHAGARQQHRQPPPLHQAAADDDAARAVFLLSYGADPHLVFEGRTALDVAQRAGSSKVAALLRSPLGAGASSLR